MLLFKDLRFEKLALIIENYKQKKFWLFFIQKLFLFFNSFENNKIVYQQLYLSYLNGNQFASDNKSIFELNKPNENSSFLYSLIDKYCQINKNNDFIFITPSMVILDFKYLDNGQQFTVVDLVLYFYKNFHFE